MFRKIFNFVFGISVLSIVSFALTGAAYISGNLPERINIKEVEKLVPVEKPEPSREELRREVTSEFDISQMVFAAMEEQESGGKRDAIRFEPSQMPRAAKFTKNPDQQRMLASSHCPMQVMGYNAAALGISWSELYDMRTCYEVSAKIFKDCFDRHREKSKLEQMRGALTCYNGSREYADVILARIAQRLLEENL